MIFFERDHPAVYYQICIIYCALSVHNIHQKMLETGRQRMAIWRTRAAFFIPKATDIHSEYVILIAFSQELRLCERAAELR